MEEKEKTSGGMRADTEVNETSSKVMNEEEARRLLAEEKQRVETGLKSADKRGKRVLAIALTVAVILCVAGLIFGLVMRGKNGS